MGALDPQEALKNGWEEISFPGPPVPSPGWPPLVGAAWLATLLYIDAFVSPAGTGLIYTASSSRLSYAFARNHYIPRQFGFINERGVPLVSIIFSFLIGCFMFLPFPGWQQLVGFIIAATVLGYAAVPLALGATEAAGARPPAALQAARRRGDGDSSPSSWRTWLSTGPPGTLSGSARRDRLRHRAPRHRPLGQPFGVDPGPSTGEAAPGCGRTSSGWA